MSQPIPVDILSDSDSEPGGDRRNSLINESIDLTTPPPLLRSKKKPRIDSISNPSDSTVFIIDDDPTPRKITSGSTNSFVAETPFSDASFVKCSTRKRSISGESLAIEQRVVAETPMSELLKAEASLTRVPKIDYGTLMSSHNSAGESLAIEQHVVAETPMSELLKAEASLTRVPKIDYGTLMSSHNSAGESLAIEQHVVAETPMSELLKAEASLTRVPKIDYGTLMSNHNSAGESLAIEQLLDADTPTSEPLKAKVTLTGVPKIDYGTLMSNHNSAEINGHTICIESDSESENLGVIGALEPDGNVFAAKLTDESEFEARRVEPSFYLGTSVQGHKKHSQSPVTVNISEGCSSHGFSEDHISVECDSTEDESSKFDSVSQIPGQRNNSGCYMKEKKKKKKKKSADETMKPKRTSKEERLRLMEEMKKLKEEERLRLMEERKKLKEEERLRLMEERKKLKEEERLRLIEERKKLKEQEKLLKDASKAEAAELKKSKKEMQKWEKGKYALKSIVAEIDKNVVELGSIGGHLLSRFAEKGISYRITSNPVERSIVWNMVVPEEISTIASEERIEVSYVLIIYEAEEFCKLVTNESLMDHVQSVQNRYPRHTICYATNRLMAYINKREQAHYKNPSNYPGWKRPAVEEVLAKLATHYFKVHSRQCIDESELAEHVVGLTSSLASCQFRKKLTWLSVNANGSIIPKDCTEKNLIKKDVWLKALVAIPKVQPRFAIAIWKKYPTMKSLLRVYMDPTKSVHEKEFLLKDLTTEVLLGGDRRLGEVCSKRIYRILMAESGNIRTDDVENGADFFSRHSS